MKKQTRKQANAEGLFFVGLLPPADIQQEVMIFKQQAMERFKSGHALTMPAHITLLPPFRTSRTNFSMLEEFAEEQKPIEIQLQGFNRFDQRVIFVDVRPNQALIAMQKDLELYAHYHLGIEPEYRPFHPHMAVAFKDLKRPVFPEAFAYFSALSYERNFTASELVLFAYNSKSWEVKTSWELSGKR